jgi:hypothetical protein
MQERQQHRPLASFSTMRFTDYRVPQPHSTIVSTTTTTPSPSPSPSPPIEEVDTATPFVPPVVEKLKLKFIIKKKHTPTATTSDEMPAVPAIVTPVTTTPVEKQKQKLKITIVKRNSSFTQIPPNKIKITIKKKPRQATQEEKHSINHDIAPPVSMIYTPCSDYIAPPPKCCRFFIENRHCFLRSTDNACIDPINKKVFGFWNCEIGKKCELLPPPPTDDQDDYVNGDDNAANLVQLDNNDDDDCNKTIALAMRKKSDANRARITGQPIAILRQKIATKYGMHSFNSLGNPL